VALPLSYSTGIPSTPTPERYSSMLLLIITTAPLEFLRIFSTVASRAYFFLAAR
jgi:hypothetical protein